MWATRWKVTAAPTKWVWEIIGLPARFVVKTISLYAESVNNNHDEASNGSHHEGVFHGGRPRGVY